MRALLFLAFLLLGTFVLGGHAQAATPFKDCSDCPQMQTIPAGRMIMGSPGTERGRFDSEGPQHPVTVPSFALGIYDVTVGEFTAFMRDSRYLIGQCDWPKDSDWRSQGFYPADPVVCVNWNDAQAYVAWLNAKLAGGGGSGRYRLPSEAEWEYAARGDTTSSRWWGDTIGTGNADCNGCGSKWDNVELSPVGSFKPNPFGLYDMLGDVWQWTADCWNENYAGAPSNGGAWLAGDCSKRVLRGGSWSNLPEFIRSAARSRDNQTARSSDYAAYAGFRVAKSAR